jgi:hypothetical protein
MWNHATQGGEPASAVLGRHDVEPQYLAPPVVAEYTLCAVAAPTGR